jgi:DNA-binding NtrC family response regulator
MTTRMPDTLSQIEDAGATPPPEELAIVVALEGARPWAGGERFAITALDELEVGRGEIRRLDVTVARGRRTGRLTVPDPWLSTVHFRLLRTGDRLELADAGSKNGTMLDGTRCARTDVGDRAQVLAARTMFAIQRGRPLAPARHPGLATFEPALATQIEMLARLAGTDLPILIRGPTGSGKEVTAAACHELSARPGPFVAINLAAVTPTLLESELFGHRRGAFTGAIDDRLGVIRSAHRGTLFLDEIAELSLAGQAALLRVLQQREVVPVGGTSPIAVDIRVLAATHEDLATRIAAGKFRQDLFARLAGHQLVLPPLAARRADLGQLVARLLVRIAGPAAQAVRLSRGALSALFDHPWPLNIRELEHTLIRAVNLAGGGEIEAAHLATTLEAIDNAAAPTTAPSPSRDREELVRLFASHGGNLAAVARALATSPSHVRRLLQRHGVDLATLRDDLE